MADTKMVQWFDDHWYKFGEEYLPSVTTILSAYPNKQKALQQWRDSVGAEEANRIFYEAGRRGRLIHQMFAALIEGETVHYGTSENGGLFMTDQMDYLQLMRLALFMEVVKPRVLMSETMVYSAHYGYAGTLDLLLEIEGGDYPVAGVKPLRIPEGVYVADIKTSNNVQDEHYLQTAAYALAVEECQSLFVAGTLILHTKASTKGGIEGFNVKMRGSRKEFAEDFGKFEAVFECWKINPSAGKPKLIELPPMISLSENFFTKSTKLGA